MSQSIRSVFDYCYIVATLAFTVYGQLILKFRIGSHGALPVEFVEKLLFLGRLLGDPFILSGFVAAFLASMTWMAAMAQFDLSHAYPFTGLNFVVVLLLSGILLGEPLTMPKIVGVLLIAIGIIVSSTG